MKFMDLNKIKNENYEELIISIGDIQPGDQVMGTDGKWHDIEILPVHIPESMFAIEFENGGVKCSGDHLWTLYDATTKSKLTLETKSIYENIDWLMQCSVGIENGPKIKSITPIDPIPSRCISIKDSDDMLFEIFTDKGESIFTHNCQQRLICGQLGSIASRMALDDNQATTIDGTHKGAGMVKAQGVVSNIQYYFEQQKWIEKWFTDRGLTKKGWEPTEDPNASIDPNSIDLGEDEEITITKNKTVMDFRDIHKEIDNTKSQKFEEV